MAKAKSPKTKDNNEAVAKIAAQPNVPGSEAGETAASFEKTTTAESTKPKATKSRAAKNAATAIPAPQVSVPRLEAVPSETRTNGEGRGTVVPFNLENEIRKVAYLLSERRGFVPGHEREDWLAAEREVLQRYRQQQRA